MTATKGERSFAVDTSIAVAAIDESHAGHAVCRSAVLEFRPALAGHAAYETYSVLTRLPGALRVEPGTAADLIPRMFPVTCWLDPADHDDLMRRIGGLKIAGGAVYDALVGRAAAAHGRTLLTRDRRAARTYQMLDVDFEAIDE